MTHRILVVDDDPEALALIRMLLQHRGFDTLGAGSGTQALGLLARETPDLVVMDVMMPHMDGYEVCRHIRADPRIAHLPVVLLTAKADTGSQMEGWRAGADDYIAKPVRANDLLQHVQALLEQSAPAPGACGRLVMVTGARGGVGATTLAANLSLALAARARTVLVDLEAGGSAGLHLGLRPARGLSDLLARGDDALRAVDVQAALSLHPSGLQLLGAAGEPVGETHLGQTVNHLLALCDVCLLDLGAGFSPAARSIVPRCDDFVLVFDADRVSLLQAERLMQSLDDAGLPGGALRLVWVNRLGIPVDAGSRAIQAVLGQTPLAIVEPAAGALYQALEQGQPLVACLPEHPAAVQMHTLADQLLPGAA